jgi:hypothetical protein
VFSSIAARGGPRVRISWVADVENSKAALRMIGETSDSLTVEEASGWCVLEPYGSVDVVLAGIVCGSISPLNISGRAGNRLCVHTRQAGTGETWGFLASYIRSRPPGLVILENSTFLDAASAGGSESPFRCIQREMADLGYSCFSGSLTAGLSKIGGAVAGEKGKESGFHVHIFPSIPSFGHGPPARLRSVRVGSLVNDCRPVRPGRVVKR